jgi:PAS domain-containing protein
MNTNGYPYPMRAFPSSRPPMMENMEDGMGAYGDIYSGQSLDQASLYPIMYEYADIDRGQIVSQNDKAEHHNRRQSMPVYRDSHSHSQQNMDMSPDNRRVSMMNFGDPGGADNFHFDMQAAGMEDMMRNNPNYPRATAGMQHNRTSANDLSLNTQFQGQNSPFASMAAPGSAYASPMHANAPLDMDMNSYPNAMSMGMNMDEEINMMSGDMNLFPGNNQFNPHMTDSPVAKEFIGPMPAPPHDGNITTLQSQDRLKRASTSNTPEARSTASNMPSRASSQDQSSKRSNSRPHSEQHSSSRSTNFPTQMSLTSLKNQQPIALNPEQDLPRENMNQINDFKLPWTPPTGGFPSTMHSNPHMKTQFKDAYSSTGFDMLGVLMRVASRPDPQIDIGSVDLSCAFVVCDAEIDDNPIVYCSDNFERLTGYTRHMILGRNCRFLQSPDGKVEAGIKRKYVDDDSVLYLKNMISTRSEAQISLINYRRGGQPFMNLLTMIPVAWEPGGSTKFFVGFQVDLVEQPGSMTDKNSGKCSWTCYSCVRTNGGQMALTGSITIVACPCPATSSTTHRSHSKNRGKPFPRMRSRMCLRHTAARGTPKSHDESGIRSSWRTLTMSCMSCLSKDCFSICPHQAVGCWSTILAN